MEFAVFLGDRILARSDLATAAQVAHANAAAELLVIDTATGRVVDLDLRGPWPEALARLRSAAPSKASRGRPKLGVVAREVTLLPRHWDWLAAQPGGASAALRRLVDQARRDTVDADARRQSQEAAYRAATALAGDRPGYEEAIRALFAGDFDGFRQRIAAWPPDIAAYLSDLIEPS
jgi:hypothetical protein